MQLMLIHSGAVVPLAVEVHRVCLIYDSLGRQTLSACHGRQTDAFRCRRCDTAGVWQSSYSYLPAGFLSLQVAGVDPARECYQIGGKGPVYTRLRLKRGQYVGRNCHHLAQCQLSRSFDIILVWLEPVLAGLFARFMLARRQ